LPSPFQYKGGDVTSGELHVKKAICWWCKPKCFIDVKVSKYGDLIDAGPSPRPDCPRWRSVKEWFHHPKRLRYPLKRAGERGEAKWKPISWDEALDEVASRIKALVDRYGPETVAVTHGTCRTYEEFRYRFLNLLGSPNQVGQSHICHGNSATVALAVLGWFPWWYPGENLRLSRCIMLVGRNPPPAHQTIWDAIREAKKRGAKLIVVDPRRSEAARQADLWLQLRPSTDAALLLSMIHVIIEEGLYDKEFVERWCYGFDELRERAKQYPPDKVAEITWVPAERIVEAARTFAANRPAVAMEGMGAAHQYNAHSVIHACHIITALTGSIDVPGGYQLLGPNLKLIHEHEMELPDAITPEQRRKQIGSDRFKMESWPGYELIQSHVERTWGKRGDLQAYTCLANAPLLYRAIITGRPYPVKALITMSSNPMITQANSKLVYEALKRLELYVVVDYFLTPSAELADYVFPAASWLERPTLYDFRTNSPNIKACGAALPASKPGEYDRRTDYEFWRGLAIRLGQREYWPWRTVEEVYDYRLKGLGYPSFKDFLEKTGGVYAPEPQYRKYEKIGFGTPTGKVELYSTVMEKLGYDPLPYFKEPPESPVSSPELAKEYPFILITGGRFLPYFHSEHRQLESFRNIYPWPRVEIHPDAAAKLGIKEGDWVWIETKMGRIMQKARLFDGIHPMVVHAQHGWWYPEMPGEEPYLHGAWVSNVNVLTDDDPDRWCDEVLGCWTLRGFLCKVYRVRDEEWNPEKPGLPSPSEFKELFKLK
jgi:anaerobic selenocysteine-containing dehydrogenase